MLSVFPVRARMTSTIAFVGGGNMARSLVGGLLARGMPPSQLLVCEPQAALREALAADFRVAVSDDNSQAAGAETLVLAVKPQVMRAVCQGLAAARGGRRPTVVSIAAGIRLAQFARWLGEDLPVVRAMPNTPALIGAGITGLVANAHADGAARERAEAVLSAAGPTVWIPDESLMDAVTAVSGSGPAYFFLLMEQLAAAGERQGLPADVARRLVLQTALGAARMACEGDEPPARLRERVTSPGGTTQAALDAFAAGGFNALVDAAVVAATQRGRALSDLIGD
jgi:pyrroline-5-carboxylate reductase